jgi:hypothetical protein
VAFSFIGFATLLAANSSKMAHKATPRTSLLIVKDGFGHETQAASES